MAISSLGLAFSAQGPSAQLIGHCPRVGLKADEAVGKGSGTDICWSQQSQPFCLVGGLSIVVDGCGVAGWQIILHFPVVGPGVVADEVESTVVECHHDLCVGWLS